MIASRRRKSYVKGPRCLGFEILQALLPMLNEDDDSKLKLNRYSHTHAFTYTHKSIHTRTYAHAFMHTFFKSFEYTLKNMHSKLWLILVLLEIFFGAMVSRLVQ